MGAGRKSQGIEQELKAKIRFDNVAYVIHFSIPIAFDVFCAHTLNACQLSSDTKVTIKIIDDEGDPCTVLSQNDLDEVIWSLTEAHATEILVHVFLGEPLAAGAPCLGEDKNVYRRGARRWKKIYKVFGHDLEPKRTNKRTNCALCHDSIWGLGRGGLRCNACGMFVHKKCHKFVRRPCTRESGNYPHSPSTPNFNHQEQMINNMYRTSPPTLNGKTGQENLINKLNRANFGGNGLDDFRLLTVIGRGSYAKVIQAEHRRTGEIFAIKIVKKTMCADEEDLDWIQTEKSVFETASNHPFLVGLHSCFQSDSRLFFVIEFILGGDLMYHMQKQQRLPEDHARFYSAEIILALHFLHSRSIVYRDLKLDNVLLDQYGHIKLTDFGMCKENIGPGDVTNTFCGVIQMIMFGDFIYCGFEVFMHYLLRYLDLVLSIHYDKHRNENMQTFSKISEPNHLNYPFAFDTKLHCSCFFKVNNFCLEILRGEEYGFSVDFWALGVLMFEMMAGRSPFHLADNNDEADAENQLFQVILERQIRIPRNLTVRAANVLKGFLNKDSQLRLGCKLDIEEGLNDIKNNAFFKDHIDWTALERRQVIPPFKPDVENDRDLSRFDTSFTVEQPTLTPDDPEEIARIDQSEFEGFEFVNPLQLGREDVV